MRQQHYASWDMAGFKARNYVPRKPYVMHGPVGTKMEGYVEGPDGGLRACRDCGHHTCSCSHMRVTHSNSIARGPREFVPQTARGKVFTYETIHDNLLAQANAERDARLGGGLALSDSQRGAMLQREMDRVVREREESPTKFGYSQKPIEAPAGFLIRAMADVNTKMNTVNVYDMVNGSRIFYYNPADRAGRDAALTAAAQFEHNRKTVQPLPDPIDKRGDFTMMNQKVPGVDNDD